MKKLLLIAILLGLIASPNLVTADERIISFDADNFDNISDDPTFRWSFDRETFRPVGDGIQLEEFVNSGPAFLSTSPSAIQVTDDCISGSCIQISGGSPDMELYTEDSMSSHVDVSGNWSQIFYFKFTDLPSVDTVLASAYSPVAGQGSWSVEYIASTSRVRMLVSTNGSNLLTLAASSGELLVDTWYLFTLKHSTATNNTVITIYDGNSAVTTGTILTAAPFNGTSQPLSIMGNSFTRGSGTVSNWEDDYTVIIDEVLIYDTDFGGGNWPDFAELIPQPSILLPEVTEYQLTAAVDVTNNTGSALTNYTIPFTVNFADLISFGFLDSSLKDFFVLNDEFSNIDYMITAGDPASNASYIFTEVPDIANTQTYTINELVGLNTAGKSDLYKIEYPFILTGNDLAVIEDTALLDLERDFSVSLPVSIPEIPSQHGWLLEKANSTVTLGYGIQIRNDGDIRIYIADQTCTYDATSDYPINDTIGFYVSGEADGNPNLHVGLAIGSNIVTTCSLATGAGTNPDDLRIGPQLIGKVYGATVTDDATGINRLEVRFDPTDYVQTQEGNSGNSYKWQGNLTTYGSVTTGGTYEIVSDLTNIAVNQTGLIVNTSEQIPVVPTINPNIIGTPPAVVTTPTPSVNLPFTPLIIDSAANIGITDQAMWFILFYAVAVMFAFGTHILLNTEFLSILVLSTIVLLGTLSGIYAAWLTASTLPLVLGVYALAQLRRVGEVA